MTVWIQITWKVEKDPNEKYRLPFPWAFDPDSWQLKNIEYVNDDKIKKWRKFESSIQKPPPIQDTNMNINHMLEIIHMKMQVWSWRNIV